MEDSKQKLIFNLFFLISFFYFSLNPLGYLHKWKSKYPLPLVMSNLFSEGTIIFYSSTTFQQYKLHQILSFGHKVMAL